MRDLQDMFREYFELDDEISKLQRQQETIREELRKELVKSDKQALEQGGYKMQFIKSERKMLDTKSFAASHPRLAKQFTRITQYTSFRINRPASNK